MNEDHKNFVAKMYDKTFRRQLQADPTLYLKELLGSAYDDTINYSITVSNKDTLYIAFPHHVDNIDIKEVAATGNTISTVASVGTFGTACTCVGTFGSAGSTGSVKV